MSRRAYGLRAWVLQRLSAVYLGIYIFFLIFHFATAAPHDYPAWQSWVASPEVAIPGLLFFLALLLHAWVGVRDVLIDYIHPLGLRLLSMGLVGLTLVGCGVWVLLVVLLQQV